MKTKGKITNFKLSKSFMLFVVFSVFFWFLITLSKQYTEKINFPLTYKNIPQDKLLQSVPATSLNVTVSGTGFKLLSAKFFKKEIVLESDLFVNKTSSLYFLLLKNQKINIEKQLVKGIEIESFEKDSIFLNLGSLVSKKIPVIPSLDIHYKGGYNLSSPITVSPDSVFISGPEESLKTISSIRTEMISLVDVSTDFTKQINLLSYDSANIRLDTSFVTVSGKIDSFTEGVLETSFSIINVPKEMKISPFPKIIQVYYTVKLSQFDQVNENSFKIICDFEALEDGRFSFLIPKVAFQQDFIKSIRLVPDKIDFLIQK